MSKNDTFLAENFDFNDTIIIPFPLPESVARDYLNDSKNQRALNNPLPLFTLRNSVMFAHVSMPIEFSKPEDRALLSHIDDTDGFFIVAYQDPIKEEGENPLDRICSVGVLCRLVRIMSAEENNAQAIVIGIKRVTLHAIHVTNSFPLAEAKSYADVIPTISKTGATTEVYWNGLLQNIIKKCRHNVTRLIESIPKEILANLINSVDPVFIVNYAIICSSLTQEVKQRLLEVRTLKQRAEAIFAYQNQESEFLIVREEIQNNAKTALDRNQRDFFLQQQIVALQQELGGDAGGDTTISDLYKEGQKKQWSEAVQKIFLKEVRKLENYNPQSPDYAVQYQYLQTLLELPWNEFSQDQFDLSKAQETLDQDHFGLEKVKERIIEHLAVLKLKKDMKSPILCLWGPPGVGKTSLGKSIADSLGRKYIRISLGGVHDEAEIRGHRRTYIGAMPGRIIQAIKKAGTANPVVVLDEIDKISSDYKGDPSSALLEVLDPEQNSTFHDNYIDIDFDLSNVLFIATANTISTISRPLLDRMELIQLSGYITEEKIEIAQRHIISRLLKEHGLKKSQFKLSNTVLEKIIEQYTRESGVRSLEKQIAGIMRKVAKHVVAEEKYNVSIKESELKDYLGIPRFSRDIYQDNKYIGVVTGLAWTSVGGEILFIESSLHTGKDCRLTLTGNLGDVMKESAIIALSYIRAHATELNIDSKQFAENELHLHVPEGAIPKDGPSAGITMVTSIVSTFTQRKVRERIAMTGEITLRGKVLPVGGVKEKILAAKRAGITDIVLCVENKKDIEEINSIYTQGIQFHYVEDIKEVLDLALLPSEQA